MAKGKCIAIDMDDTFIIPSESSASCPRLVDGAFEILRSTRDLARKFGYVFVVLSNNHSASAICDAAGVSSLFDEIIYANNMYAKSVALHSAGYDAERSWLIDDKMENVLQFERGCAGGVCVINWDLRAAYLSLVARLGGKN